MVGTQLYQAAQGYLELGLPAEALEELNHMEQADQMQADVLSLRSAILMHLKRWEEAERLLQGLCQLVPSDGEFYVHAAFCLHEMGRTDQAKQCLLEAPESLRKDPLYHYNLGCYDACLGNLEQSRDYLKACFAADKAYIDLALHDADLQNQRDWLRQLS